MDKECGKSKTEAMAQILYVHFVKQKEEHCEWNDTHSKAAQSQNDSLRPWQGGPCFRQPGFQPEVKEAKMLQQVNNLRVVHIAGCSCALVLYSLHRGASFAYG